MFGFVRLSSCRFAFKTKSDFVCVSVHQCLLRLEEKVFLDCISYSSNVLILEVHPVLDEDRGGGSGVRAHPPVACIVKRGFRKFAIDLCKTLYIVKSTSRVTQ